jgi:hypothetical protein
MPPDVTARIGAALAAEQGTLVAGSSSKAAPEPVDEVVPDLTGIRNRRRWLPTAPTAAAAGVAILAIVAIVIGLGHHSSNKQDLTTASGSSQSLAPLVGQGPANSTATTFPVETTGRNYTAANLDTLALSLATTGSTPAAGGSAPVPAPTGSQDGTETHGSGSTASGSTGSTAGPLPGTSKRTTDTPKSATGAAGSNSGTTAGTLKSAPPRIPAALIPYSGDSVHAREAILTCAAFVSTTSNAVPEAVDLSRWSNPDVKPKLKDVPALIMLFAGPPGSNYKVVYVVGPKCGDNDIYKFETVQTSK